MDYTIKLFEGTGKKKKVLHIETDPDVTCLQGIHVLNKVYLNTEVFVDIPEIKDSDYHLFLTRWWDEDCSWEHPEICGACRRTLMRRIKNGSWPRKV